VREKRRKRGRKCRNWIARRESLGASKCLFRELSSEDPQEYRKHARISVEKFEILLRLVESYISKTDTVMKAAIRGIYLANGNLTALSCYKLSTQTVQYSLKIRLCVSCDRSLLLYYMIELYCNAHQVH
jgi:DNA-binding transcriptional regulator WhiA